MMKKLALLSLLALMVISCSERGEIKREPSDFIEIHGKVYKLMQVYPCDGCNAIWIMYPKDSTGVQPEVINYNVKSGKHTENRTVIKVD